MKLDFARTQKLLKTFDFGTLFREELGWEPQRYDITVTVDGENYALQTIAHKRGFAALWLKGQIPAYALRRKIDAQVGKSYHEHLLIYTDAGQTAQVWQWVKHEPGKPTASRETTFRVDGSGAALIQKLEYLAVTLDDEERLTILDVAERVKTGFDVERVTKKFYERFKDEHAAFLKFVGGIPEEGLQRWYVSVTLNRLMFVYFIQKKGFLDDNPDYLRQKLSDSHKNGADRFYSDFLCPLFFKGFAAKKHGIETVRLLGKVPYLNGGIFAQHQIEQRYGQKIRIPDAAFERLFAFFEQYQWHLDERPLRKDNEINPDVLGYIFEKYINQKQMGAYYTKEDITEYNSKNTIIPFLFDAARKACVIAFEGNSALWKLLQGDPDRYIYPAVRHGVELPLPAEIAAGLPDTSLRGGWNKPAPLEYALPTETWREVVARRQKYTATRQQLESGEVHEINALITLNLNIRQFAQDVIENAEGVDLLRAFWKAIQNLTLLDPTVGSGAFLFAALNVLEPLYEACLERMQVFVDELDASAEAHRPEKFSDFRKVLAEIERHPNRRYFILKSIMVNNLYGVDIMDEAVEICKLRLFLKLVAQVERVEQVEPLPDIDFNIRAGNTLVGFARRNDVEKALQEVRIGKNGKGVQDKLFVFEEESGDLKRIQLKAEDVERLFKLFRQQQTELGGEVTQEAKEDLKSRLKELDDELNVLLARQYTIHNTKGDAFDKWLKAHKPFHWFVEFYGIMSEGGFDVIIGNPPWSEYSTVRKDYQIQNYITEKCGNLYAICIERSIQLRSHNGRLSFIVQLPLATSSRMSSLRKLLLEQNDEIHIIPFGDRPGKLFDGLEHSRSVIFLAASGEKSKTCKTSVTRFQRWPSVFRSFLFHSIDFITIKQPLSAWDVFPKYSSNFAETVFQKVLKGSFTNLETIISTRRTDNLVFYQEATEYWIKATLGLPYYAKDGVVDAPAHGRFLYFDNQNKASVVFALLNSSLFFSYFTALSDCFHLNDSLVKEFRIPKDIENDEDLVSLGEELIKSLSENAQRKRIQTKTNNVIDYDEFYGWKSKPIIDQIDRALARHYGLTAEELDFIINYDIKYRLGAGAGDDADSE